MIAMRFCVSLMLQFNLQVFEMDGEKNTLMDGLKFFKVLIIKLWN